jgi:hypothetical protein
MTRGAGAGGDTGLAGGTGADGGAGPAGGVGVGGGTQGRKKRRGSRRRQGLGGRDQCMARVSRGSFCLSIASGQTQVDTDGPTRQMQVDVKWADTPMQVGSVPPTDRWVPLNNGPPVIDLYAETHGTKRNTVACGKKKQPRINGQDAPVAAIGRPRMPNRRGGELHMHELYL